MVPSTHQKSVLLISMPFADTIIPSIQLSLLESYLHQKSIQSASLHLYVNAADFYGISQYSTLIYPPNDPYVSQMVFSKYVFPTHWEKNKEQFKTYYTNHQTQLDENTPSLSFEEYEKKTDDFLRWVTQSIDWKSFDIIGFSVNYGQFLASLTLAQIIKQDYPEAIIVFGGSTTINKLGIKIISTFDCIDYIVTGEGEEPLYKMATFQQDHYHQIPGLIGKKKGKGILYEKNTYMDMNTLPYPDFSSFYQTLQKTNPQTQQYIQLNIRLPIEISRGCWWNKCSFCNQSAYHPYYREKSINRFISELSFLTETYTQLSYQVIGSTLPPKNIQKLCHGIISLQKDYSFIAETRADQLKSEDYHLLHQAGFHKIQTGIESLSPHYIQKMNKGTRVIDNIATLKFCKEYGITNEYNLITNLPTEKPIDFKETKQTISLIQSYLDPPHLSTFVVGYQSPIYKNLSGNNIKKLKPKTTDTIMFPYHILEKKFQFFTDYIPKIQPETKNWKQLINTWKEHRTIIEEQAVKTKNILDTLLFYYIDGGSFIKIFDKRSMKDVNIYILDEKERDVFLCCHNIKTFNELSQELHHLSEEDLKEILTSFIENQLIYKEKDAYLSLPLCYTHFIGCVSQDIQTNQAEELIEII